jgi:hypothetical protein
MFEPVTWFCREKLIAGFCYHLVNVFSSSLSQSDRIKRRPLLLVIAHLSIQLLFRKRKLELKFLKVEDKKLNLTKVKRHLTAAAAVATFRREQS